MIIQCDHCSAKFKMDDAKLANGPVKVRCARCKEVFVVKPETTESGSQPGSAPSAVSVDSALQSNMAPPGSEDQSSASPAVLPVQSQTDDESANSFSFDVGALAGQPASDTVENKDAGADSFDWQDNSAPFSLPAVDKSFDLSSFDASFAATSAGSGGTVAGADADSFDFGEVDFSAAPSNVEPAVKEKSDNDDFSADFGEVSFSDAPANGFSLNDSGTGEESSAADAKSPVNSDEFIFAAPAVKSAAVIPFDVTPESSTEKVNFGDFSFGEMNEKSETHKEATFPTELPVSPTVGSSPFDSSFEADGDLPPTSLITRKKGESFFSSSIICGAFVLIIALVFSGVYLFGGAKAFSKVGLGFLVEWYGGKTGEEGNIVLKGVTASYVQNSVAGELFVVRGEAVNNYKKPRASVQVKVAVLGQGGTVLITKSAYCGNSLSNDQLSSMPVAKIDETLNNQFGDSLVNLGLKPGGSIPFVVVVNPVPKDPKDYTVQVSGSTVATQ